MSMSPSRRLDPVALAHGLVDAAFLGEVGLEVGQRRRHVARAHVGPDDAAALYAGVGARAHLVLEVALGRLRRHVDAGAGRRRTSSRGRRSAGPLLRCGRARVAPGSALQPRRSAASTSAARSVRPIPRSAARPSTGRVPARLVADPLELTLNAGVRYEEQRLRYACTSAQHRRRLTGEQFGDRRDDAAGQLRAAAGRDS